MDTERDTKESTSYHEHLCGRHYRKEEKSDHRGCSLDQYSRARSKQMRKFVFDESAHKACRKSANKEVERRGRKRDADSLKIVRNEHQDEGQCDTQHKE